jgi:hypothetical protein
MDLSAIMSLFGAPQMMGAQQQPQMGQFMDPMAMAQLQADNGKLQRNQALAQAFMQGGSQYIPNSGYAGLGAGLAQLIRGKMLQSDNDEKVTDILKRTFEAQSQAAQAKRQQDLEDEARKLQEDIYKATQIARGEGAAKKEFAMSEFKDGGVFNPGTGEYTPSQAWTDQQMNLARQKAALEAANRQGPADPFRDIKLALQQGVITPQQAQQAMAAKVMGNGQQNAPSGYQWKPDGSGLQPISGGPADPATTKNKPIPADMAGKISLAEGYLQNAPGIQSEISKGTLTGLIDANTAQLGYGKGGEVYRQIQSGRDALQRTLTGAGMPASEAAEYANRYLPTARDTTETLASKQRQLQQELQRFVTIAKTGQDITPDSLKSGAQGQLSDADLLKKYGGM